MKFLFRVYTFLINKIYRLWCSTLRITVINIEPLFRLDEQGKLCVVCLWHNEFFALMHIRARLRLSAIVSQSKDGEYLALFLESLGLKVARGSSSRGGLRALVSAARLMKEDRRHCCVTMDGPRGPRHKVKEGAIFLAAHAKASLLPIRLFSPRAKVFNSWDKFRLPLPFSRVYIVLGDPYQVGDETISPEMLKRECAILQAKMDAIQNPAKGEPL